MFGATFQFCLVLLTTGLLGMNSQLAAASDLTPQQQRTQRDVLNRLNRLIADIEQQRAAHSPAVAEKPRVGGQAGREGLLRKNQVLLRETEHQRAVPATRRELAQAKVQIQPRGIKVVEIQAGGIKVVEEVQVITRPAEEPAPATRPVPESSEKPSPQKKKPQVDPESLEGILKRARTSKPRWPG